jgi:hypothetical protein
MTPASSFADMLNAGKRVKPFTGLEDFGLTLFCCSITELESAEHESSSWKTGTTLVDPGKLKQTRRKLLALTVCDENGRRLLTDEQAGQIDSRLAEILYDQSVEHIKPAKPKNSPSANGDDSESVSRCTADATPSTGSSAK